MNCNRNRSIEQQMLDALLTAAKLTLDDVEYDVALDAISYYASNLDEMPANFSIRIVEEVESALGLGLEPRQHSAAVAAAQSVIEPARPPEPEPDAFLEMAYEDRVSGNYDE